MDRQTALDLAAEAAAKAALLAESAERAAHASGPVDRLAASGALWADTSRAYTALAAVLPDTETH